MPSKLLTHRLAISCERYWTNTFLLTSCWAGGMSVRNLYHKSKVLEGRTRLDGNTGQKSLWGRPAGAFVPEVWFQLSKIALMKLQVTDWFGARTSQLREWRAVTFPLLSCFHALLLPKICRAVISLASKEYEQAMSTVGPLWVTVTVVWLLQAIESQATVRPAHLDKPTVVQKVSQGNAISNRI